MAILLGSLGADEINGTTLGDLITALSGDDTVVGAAGADTIDGGDGNDVLYAGTKGNWLDGAVDTVLGGLGDDHIYGEAGDILDGGLGNDVLSLDLSSASTGMSLDFRAMTLGVDLGLGGLTRIEIPLLTGRLANFEVVDQVIGSQFADELFFANVDRAGSTVDGGGGDDTIRTGGGVDHLLGGNGADRLTASGGSDVLDGGAGNDILYGGHGKDVLTGGSGRDLFTFNDGDTGHGRNSADTITDFSRAEDDHIVLRSIDAIPGGDDDRFTFIGTDRFSGTAGELRFTVIGGDTFVAADLDGDKVSDLSIRLEGVVDLVASDFVL